MIPYLEKSDFSFAQYMQKLISEIEQRFNSKERENEKPLGSGFLNAFLSMRRALKVKNGLNNDAWKAFEPKPALLNDRNAVYGALLSLENETERSVLDREKEPEENRLSNAARFLPQAAKRPIETTDFLFVKMASYQKKLFCAAQIAEEKERLFKIINENRWNTNEPLGSAYLHTYYTYKFLNRKDNQNEHSES